MKKKLILGLCAFFLATIIPTGFVSASADDFTITDFQADYYLDKDIDGHSTLKTIETITAEFPNYDQNHGIERALPSKYDSHTTNLKVQSIQDQNGNNLNYSTYNDSNGNLVLRIGNADVYVHGSTTYVITYTQRDVTRFFKDTNDDEFYWDVNGTGWSQLFNKVTARLHIGSGITNALTNNNSCYYGISGSTNQCDISISDNVITAASKNLLNAGENMTIAVGFKANTFTAYKMTSAEKVAQVFSVIWGILSIVSLVFAPVILVILLVLKFTKGKNAPGRGTIVPEYLPPKDVDIAQCSIIGSSSSSWTAAMYIDFAVRHKIKIIERESKKTAYSFELVSSEGLTKTEREVMAALFGDNLAVGTRYDFIPDEYDSNLRTSITLAYDNAKKSLEVDGYYENIKNLRMKMILWTVILAIFCLPNIYLGVISVSIAIVIILLTKPLSIKGRELSDYLKGLEMYIKVAEEDRIKVLQSPQGVEKTPVDTDDTGLLLHLYERVLPYAILFNNEEEWVKTLGKYYEQQGTTPDWYTSNSLFNVAVFTSALSNFSSDMSSYDPPTSSSSGGSSGGGFSGGGGGGGGGGGW